MHICPDCRTQVFGRGWERVFEHSKPIKSDKKIACAFNDPWVRFGSLLSFSQKKVEAKMLALLAEVAEEELPCPESRLEEGHTWYHLRDSETGKDYTEFQVCSHCVYSLEVIYPNLGDADIFHSSKDIKKKDPHVCDLRNDVMRFSKYLDLLTTLSQTPKGREINTSDFIWEVKWMTVISPCNGSAVHYGQDMHIHPALPEFTVCEECYYKTVRPLLKTLPPPPSSSPPSHRDQQAQQQQHWLHALPIEPKEIVGGSTCKLYSPRMKQIFATAVKDNDFEYLVKAVKKRQDLLVDLEEAKGVVAKARKGEEGDRAREELEWLKGKWEKLEKKH